MRYSLKKLFLTITIALSICIGCSPVVLVNYIDEKDQDGTSIDFLGDKNWISFRYLGDRLGMTTTVASKNLDGYLQTRINIPVNIKADFIIDTVKIIECHTEIRDNKNSLIPFKSIEIEDSNFYEWSNKSLNTKSFTSESNYLQSYPVVNLKNKLSQYIIYYTYKYDDLKKVDEATFILKLKLIINGKVFPFEAKKKIKKKKSLGCYSFLV